MKPQLKPDPTRDIDRTGWPPGPWDDEPDRIEWRHRGVPCLMLRNRFGNWCGYAAVPPGHPWHGKHYGDVEVDVHGGLTYADRCEEGGRICHVAQPGEPDDVWWLGFDCGHAGDLAPGIIASDRQLGIDMSLWKHTTYKDVAYVCAEIESLADRLLGVQR